MNVRFSPTFERSYARAPTRIQNLFDQKLLFLLENLRHVGVVFRCSPKVALRLHFCGGQAHQPSIPGSAYEPP
jgi:mRNA-degrading endonuclease RelE of RelBE toxin-antitoxin system